jgi:hypothetical protein
MNRFQIPAPGPARALGAWRAVRRASALVMGAAWFALAWCASPAPSGAAAPPVADPRNPLIRPWIPPQADSITAWTVMARSEFQRNVGDSLSETNVHPYQTVANIGRYMIRTLGRKGMTQANAIEPALRGLGFNVDVRMDPTRPEFILLMIHNPYRLTASAAGYMFWWRGDDLKDQAFEFQNGLDPRMRVWWTGEETAPYMCGIIDHVRVPAGSVGVTLLRMGPGASYWDLIQFSGGNADLRGRGEASWQDVNGDGVPELVAWMRVPSDSLFSDCKDCAALFNERVFTIHRSALELEDSRIVPTVYATFQQFIRALTAHDRAAALRLVARPTLVDSAVAAGWGADRAAHAWQLEEGDVGQAWPRWLALRHDGARGRPRYAVHFALHDGRWIISHWFRERYAGTDSVLRVVYGTPDDAAPAHVKRSAARPKPAAAHGGTTEKPK